MSTTTAAQREDGAPHPTNPALVWCVACSRYANRYTGMCGCNDN